MEDEKAHHNTRAAHNGHYADGRFRCETLDRKQSIRFMLKLPFHCSCGRILGGQN